MSQTEQKERTLSEMLIQAREKFGFTMIAVESDVSTSQIQLMIKGKEPKLKVRTKIESYLKSKKIKKFH